MTTFSYSITAVNKWDGSVIVEFSKAGKETVSRRIGVPADVPANEIQAYVSNQAAMAAPWDVWALDIQAVESALAAAIEDSQMTEIVIPVAPEPTVEEILATAKVDKLREIAAAKSTVESAGLNYEFSPSVFDYVQLRNDRDRGNITGLAATALILKSQGVTDPVLAFRAESNVSYDMTPDGILAMSMAASMFISSLYQTGWSLKESIAAATTIEELETISWPQ